MENKEPVKISLTTFVLSFLLFIAVVVIIGMAIYFNDNRNLVKSENIKVNSNNVTSDDFKSEDNDKIENNNNNVVKDEKVDNKTADQLYKDYINNFIKNLDAMKEDEFDKETVYLFNSTRGDDLIFDISINKNHEALIRFTQGSKLERKYPDGYKVENVVKAFMVPDGNGDYYCVDFIKDDGSLYSLDYDKLFNSNEVVVNKNTKYKNVVDVIRVGTSAIHVDINGNWLN